VTTVAEQDEAQPLHVHEGEGFFSISFPANAMEKEMLYKLGVQDGAVLPLDLTPSRKTV
jgi:hypothetical protein